MICTVKTPCSNNIKGHVYGLEEYSFCVCLSVACLKLLHLTTMGSWYFSTSVFRVIPPYALTREITDNFLESFTLFLAPWVVGGVKCKNMHTGRRLTLCRVLVTKIIALLHLVYFEILYWTLSVFLAFLYSHSKHFEFLKLWEVNPINRNSLPKSVLIFEHVTVFSPVNL